VGRIRSYEFTNPAQVKEMTLEEPGIEEKCLGPFSPHCAPRGTSVSDPPLVDCRPILKWLDIVCPTRWLQLH